MTIPNILLSSLKKDMQQVLDYFDSRWNKAGQINIAGLENHIRKNFMGILASEIKQTQKVLIEEVSNDLDFISSVQSYDIGNLTLKVLDEDLDNFSNWLTNNLKPLNSCEINNALISAEINGDDYIQGIDLPASIMNEEIQERIQDHLLAELNFSTMLELYLSGLNIRSFICKYLRNSKTSNTEVFPTLFDELLDHSIHNNKSKWIEDTYCDELCSGIEYKNIQIDGLYLIIFYLIEGTTKPTKPTKPTNIKLEELLATSLEIKDCFSYILQLQQTSFQSLQKTLSSVKAEKLQVNSQLNTYVSGTQKGRDNKHKFSHTYRPLIESTVEEIFSETTKLKPMAIFNDSRMQALIQKCWDDQAMDAVKPFTNDTFITWIKLKLRVLKNSHTSISTTKNHP